MLAREMDNPFINSGDIYKGMPLHSNLRVLCSPSHEDFLANPKSDIVTSSL